MIRHWGLVGTTVALLAFSGQAAHAAESGGTARVAGGSVRFDGNDLANDVRVQLAGARLQITDVHPITVGEGCFDGGRQEAYYLVNCLPQGNAVIVRLGGGDDQVVATGGVALRANGGAGDDILTGGELSDSLTDDFGADRLRGLAGNDSLNTGLSPADGLVDVLEGGDGDDTLTAGGSDDKLYGNQGDDTLFGGLGADSLSGGGGAHDVVSYLDGAHSTYERLSITIDGVANDGMYHPGPPSESGSVEKDNVAMTVEDVVGGDGPDYIAGSDLANVLIGNGGNDIIEGYRGADVITGNAGRDNLYENEFRPADRDFAVDHLDGGSEADFCAWAPADPDTTTACESLPQDS